MAVWKTHIWYDPTAETVHGYTDRKQEHRKKWFNLFFTAHFMYKTNPQKAIQNKTKCIKHSYCETDLIDTKEMFKLAFLSWCFASCRKPVSKWFICKQLISVSFTIENVS